MEKKICECGERESLDDYGYCQQCREEMEEREKIIARDEALKDERRER